MLKRARLAGHLLRHLGPGWVAYRAGYAVQTRAGLLRRKTRSASWTSLCLKDLLLDPSLAEPERYLAYRRDQSRCFFFSPSDRADYRSLLRQWDVEGISPVEISDELAEGKLRYFEHTVVPTEFPPDWHRSPLTGQRIEADKHWSEIGDFGHGDIKAIWEPSRFGFAYNLVRAYWRTGEERYPELFWQLVESWREQNPPYQGPNWKCGQETSFRIMAWCFALYGFLDSAASMPARVAELAQMITISARRVEANLTYALSQRNNHGISEGLGLWTVGSLFPEMRQSRHWRKKGREVLEAQGRKLIYSDGAFSQHSLNYHRLMLHNYLWALRLGDLLATPFSAKLKVRIRKAATFLYSLQDEQTGRVPRYGPSDGSLVLPLSNCDYSDFRPVISALGYYATGKRLFSSGPWDEDLVWLFGPEALRAPQTSPTRLDLKAEAGGYYTLRDDNGFAFVRCATNFRHRPADADMLHLDLWWRGQNVALDPGTYSYNAPAPWDNALSSTAYHNTVTVDGRDQMERAGRFLWMPWLHGQVHNNSRSTSLKLAYWEGEHNGYRRLPVPVRYMRGVVKLGGEHWLVLDSLRSSRDHSYRLHWLLPDVPHQWDPKELRMELRTPNGPYSVSMAASTENFTTSLIRASEETPRGWVAPYYYTREPALSLDLVADGSNVLLWTLFGPGMCRVLADIGALTVSAAGWEARVQLCDEGEATLVSSIAVVGSVNDTLEVYS